MSLSSTGEVTLVYRNLEKSDKTLVRGSILLSRSVADPRLVTPTIESETWLSKVPFPISA
jgi:hypothetical protein